MSITAFGVVGGGQMGNGIAHVAALTGYDVTVVDISADALDRARANIEKNLARMVKKEAIAQDVADAALARITFSTEMTALTTCQLVVEAATENVRSE
ncbi:MAG: 3-hydroxybutyryl-CoA dehydrogenase, partial [Myxococcales bacterium]|nr:3-hydroxybutyryl-CoA dehydrogenase [Myxococcales bacterium]